MPTQGQALPAIVIQQLASTNTFTGVVPTDGTDTGVSASAQTHGGRQWTYAALTDGGRFELPHVLAKQLHDLEKRDVVQTSAGGALMGPDPVGASIQRVYFNGLSTTVVVGDLVDPAGLTYRFLDTAKNLPYDATAALAPATFVWAPSNILFVPPGWHVKFVTTTNVTAAASLAVHFSGGWGIIPGQTVSPSFG